MAGKTLVSYILVAAFAVGCTGSAALQVGSPPEPPPPPPPAAPVAAPTPPPAAAPAPAPVAAPPAAPKSAVTNEGGKLGVPGNIVFETGKAILKPESEPTLSALQQYMDENKGFTKIRVEGHTDNDGKAPDNLKLSQDRALAVVEWLAAKGVDKARFIPVGFGDTKPIADNKTPEGKAQNRRTEFHIAELNGKPIKGKEPLGGGTLAVK